MRTLHLRIAVCAYIVHGQMVMERMFPSCSRCVFELLFKSFRSANLKQKTFEKQPNI